MNVTTQRDYASPRDQHEPIGHFAVEANGAAPTAPQADPERLANRGLVPAALWDRLVSRVESDEEVPRELAERIMDQALGFLKLASLYPTVPFSPSGLVDIGWHAFLMYTRDYETFCCNLTGGRFIHHEPSDDPSKVNRSMGPQRTAEAMRCAGISVDDALWACLHEDKCTCSGDQPCQCGHCNY